MLCNTSKAAEIGEQKKNDMMMDVDWEDEYCTHMSTWMDRHTLEEFWVK